MSLITILVKWITQLLKKSCTNWYTHAYYCPTFVCLHETYEEEVLHLIQNLPEGEALHELIY